MTRGGKRKECLWCNFPEPDDLHDWRFAGFNKRERYNLRRFVERLAARIESMPGRKRGYIRYQLAELLSVRDAGCGVVRSDPQTPSLALAAAAKGGARPRE
jgi:hypothetical protein